MANKKEQTTPEQTPEELVEQLKTEFEKLLSNRKILQAAVIFVVDGEDEPQVYRKGHFYDTAAMMNHILNAYRTKAAMDLGMH